MDATILSAMIALGGVLISVLISFFSNRRLLNTEIEKLKTSIEQEYANRLVEKRLEYYPKIYELLSDLSKKSRFVEKGLNDSTISLKEINEFHDNYNSTNSKYGVYFSSTSSGYSWQLRQFLIDLLNKYNSQKELEVIDEKEILKLRTYIGDLEFSLKNDIGIYLVEFQDAKRKLSLNKHSDVLNERSKRKKM